MNLLGITAVTTAIFVSIIFFLIARKAGKDVETAKSFYAGKSDLKPVKYKETYLATNATFTAVILVLTEIGYKFNWWAYSAVLAWILGMYYVRWLFINRLMPSFREGTNPLTLHEYCGTKLSSQLIRRVLAGVTILAFLGTLAAEGIGIAYTFIAFDVINKLYLPIVLIFILFLFVKYAQMSGFPGVLATEKIQIIFISLCYISLVLIVILNIGNPALPIQPTIIQVKFLDGLMVALGFLVLFVPFNLCVSDMWQRCYATKWDPTVVQEIASSKMVISFAVLFLVPISIGIFCRNIGIIAPADGYLLLHLVTNTLGRLPTIVTIIGTFTIISGFVAGAISTSDTLLVNSGFIFEYDWRLQTKLDKINLKRVKEAVLVIGLSSIVLIGPEFFFPNFNLVDLISAVFSNQISFAPIILLAIITKKQYDGDTPTSILVTSILLSITACIFTVILGSVINDETLVVAAPIVGIIITSIGTFIFILKDYSISDKI